MKCSCKDININILLVLFIMISNGKWQPVYSMVEEKSSQGPIKKINQFQDSDTSRFIEMSNSKTHRIVKKQMGPYDRGLDNSLQEKGRMSARDININRGYNDSTSITHKEMIPNNECKTIGRFPDVFDSSKYYDCKFQNRTPQQITCPRNTMFNPESLQCEKKRHERDAKNYDDDYDLAAASDNDFEPINNFEPICPMKCQKEPPGTNYMVKVLPCDKDDDDDDDDDDDECEPCDPCKKVIKNKMHPFPLCNKCYYCFEQKPIKIKFLYNIACPGSRNLCCTPPPQPCPPKCKPAVKLPPFVCKPPQCRQVLYCKYFQCNSLGFFPDEKDCTKYFFCDLNNNGFVMYHMACPPGRIFDPKLRECRLKDVMKKRDVERCWIEKDVQKLSDIMKAKKKKKNVLKVKADKLKFDIILNKKKRDSRLKETSVENPLKINGQIRQRRDLQETSNVVNIHKVTPNPKLVFDVNHPIPENVFTDRNYGASGSTYRIPIPEITTPPTTCPPCEVHFKPKTIKKGKKKPPKPCPPKPCPPKPCPVKPRRKLLSRATSIHDSHAELRNSAGVPIDIGWLPTDKIYLSEEPHQYYPKRRKCTSVGVFPDPFDCQKYIKCESTEMVGNVKGRPLTLIRRVCPPGSFFHKKDLQCRSKNDYMNKYLVRHCFRNLYITNRRLKDKLARLTEVLKTNTQHQDQDYQDYPDDGSD